MEWAGMDEDTAIENPLVNKTIENAQIRVEGYHFDIRKHLVDYDDVVNKHRELIYGERRKILSGADLKANIVSMVREEIQNIVAAHTGNEHASDHDMDVLIADAAAIFPLPPELNAAALSPMPPKEIEDKLMEAAEALYGEREKEVGPDNMRIVERLVMLRTMDNLWVEHLTNMEDMRHGIGLHAVAQRDPLVAYKREGHEMFQNLLASIRHDVARMIYHVNVVRREEPQKAPVGAQAAAGGSKKQHAKVGGKKVGRNDPCPCGSGKKYKHCCGK
jgi:preprotein translocase subunit SecA